MVYVMQSPARLPGRGLATYVRAESPDRFQFREGRVLAPVPPPAVFEFDGTSVDLGMLDFLPNNVSLPVAGPRAMQVLSRYAGEDYQPLPAVVRTLDATSTEFTLLNITCTVNALDREKCVVDYIEGTSAIMGFRRLAYRDDGMGSRNLAREAEYHSHILLSQKLVAELRAVNVTGATFRRPESMVL